MFGYDLVTVLVVLIAIMVLAKPIIKLIDFAGAIAIGICGVIVAAVVLIIGGFVWLWKRLNVRKRGSGFKLDTGREVAFKIYLNATERECLRLGIPMPHIETTRAAFYLSKSHGDFMSDHKRFLSGSKQH